MRLSKKFAAIAITAGVALTATAAFGFWSSSGEGSGSASTGESSLFVVSSEDAVGDALTPGGPTNTIDFTVTNPSSGHQQLDTIDISVANADGTPWNDGLCTADDFSVTGYDSTPDVNLDPTGGAADSFSDTVTLQMVDTGVNQDACQDVTVPLYILAG